MAAPEAQVQHPVTQNALTGFTTGVTTGGDAGGGLSGDWQI